MVDSTQPAIADKLDALRAELAELAFNLDNQGRADASDVAMMLSARLEELKEELTPTP